jgi:hypothetical protein
MPMFSKCSLAFRFSDINVLYISPCIRFKCYNHFFCICLLSRMLTTTYLSSVQHFRLPACLSVPVASNFNLTNLIPVIFRLPCLLLSLPIMLVYCCKLSQIIIVVGCSPSYFPK